MRGVLDRLERWVRAGWIRELDRAFAAFLAREAPDADPALLLAAALASHQLGRGHACLELQPLLDDPVGTLALPPERGGHDDDAPDDPAAAPEHPRELLAGLDLPGWTRRLAHPRLVAPGEGDTPLVLDDGRLYLRRYWDHERTVRAGIAARLAAGPASPEGLAAALRVLFAQPPGETADWQRLACATAARHAFSVITGGPGTGKTTTVVKVLALLQHLALQGQVQGLMPGRPLRIRLAAPTGKAAARLNESIAGAVQQLPLEGLPQPQAVRAAIPTEVSTVHRLLGSLPDSRHFRHHEGNRLPLDVLVLDEASMVDLEMMAAVLRALPPQARLILLGDKDQLASVEAGAVLGELCRRADQGHYTEDNRRELQALTGQVIPSALVDAAGTPLDQVVVKLRHSWRFREDSGIGQLAAAVHAGDAARLARIEAAAPRDLAFVELGGEGLRRLVLGADGGAGGPSGGRAAPAGHAHYLRVMREGLPAPLAGPEEWNEWAARVLAAFGEFQLLCALRQGPQGVETLNRTVAAILCREGLVETDQGWYAGRPVMVTRNDYGLGLMNGDVGITLATPVLEDGAVRWKLRVAFAAESPGAGRGPRWVLPSRLQAVETVYAMTVHKSQGSEFGHAALVLPAADSRVLTRELVYTGITRARQWFTLARAGGGDVLAQAVARRVRRAGGSFG
ncbi:exodeoxyribonuclease V subunit alpha [Ramlibacter sp. AW1]|uniref:RecBCD enzyme subunit RecD n=1 Tax=Ramlibacter aurantiacus TaxID=2801330 RepID=A0A936ZMD6_9BURK|nr:exodeoxyribonuclease V subunit alpha [Ramlibacter aurantiacus]MBL0419935.1 exodeoxyribonuclease V subunit alpha [Ramlibacter aurantiacus]